MRSLDWVIVWLSFTQRVHEVAKSEPFSIILPAHARECTLSQRTTPKNNMQRIISQVLILIARDSHNWTRCCELLRVQMRSSDNMLISIRLALNWIKHFQLSGFFGLISRSDYERLNGLCLRWDAANSWSSSRHVHWLSARGARHSTFLWLFIKIQPRSRATFSVRWSLCLSENSISCRSTTNTATHDIHGGIIIITIISTTSEIS